MPARELDKIGTYHEILARIMISVEGLKYIKLCEEMVEVS